MREANINYIPHKETKSNTFSVRLKDSDHNLILSTALLRGEVRAVTMEEMAILGCMMWRSKQGITNNNKEIEEMLVEHGILSSAPNHN